MVSQEYPLMPKATAVWLVDNTALTFKQIADFCGMHELEIQGIADGDVSYGIVGQSPIASGQLAKEEIKRCEKNNNTSLKLKQSPAKDVKVTTKKGAKYVPVARRGDKPDGIAFLLKYYPEITDTQIRKLIGTTKAMIESIRSKTHWNYRNIKPRDPVLLGLCSQSQFNTVIDEVNSSKPKGKEE
ncbi:cell cycle transcriptional regulator TrcR [Pseudomonadota bacterium]